MKFFNKNKDNDTIGFSKEPISFNNYEDSERYDPVVYQIMQNDGVNICAEACACCWDTALPSKYDERAEYISKRTKIGHGSVTEHSNHVFYMEVEDSDSIELAEFLSKCRFVYTSYKHSNIYSKGYLIIGGSWRAFSDIIKMHTNVELNSNAIMIRLMNAISMYINSCGMKDLITNGTLEESIFDNVNSEGISKTYRSVSHYSINNNIEIISMDNFNLMLDYIKEQCPEPELFTIFDLLDMCTITVLFKNMSRIITQQLTRHRNAITQESQRYVNYAKGGFNSPALFKEKYDPKYTYSIQFGKSSQKMTLQEIGEAINSIYGQLIDETRTQKHNLQFEDARGYLANNTQCGKIYITFTWRTFFMFLFLREDKHAQVEIRNFAIELGKWFRELLPEYDNLYEALTPKPVNESNYCYPIVDGVEQVADSIDNITIDEIIEKLEEQIEIQDKLEEKED